MKIAHVTGHLSSRAGGFAASVAGLARETCLRHGVNTVIVGIRDARDPDGWRQWAEVGLQVRALPWIGVGGMGWAPALKRALDQEAPDLVHAHGLWMFQSRASLAWHRRTGRPHVISPHGMLDAWAVRRANLKKALAARLFERAHLERAACLHALNDAEAQAIRAYGLRNPICIVPNAVSLPTIATPVELNAGPRRLLFLGRIDPKKGIDNLLEAWRSVAEDARQANWILQITGWGTEAYTSGVRKTVRKYGIQDIVLFTGPLYGSAKAEALSLADAFILPSFSEGMPMAVLEAWSYARPVLMTSACNLPEGFQAGAALTVAPTAASQAEVLRRLFCMPLVELRQLGLAGRRLVEEKFLWQRAARDMVSVYRWLLKGGSCPDCVHIG